MGPLFSCYPVPGRGKKRVRHLTGLQKTGKITLALSARTQPTSDQSKGVSLKQSIDAIVKKNITENLHKDLVLIYFSHKWKLEK
jgi:hypothetical protein